MRGSGKKGVLNLAASTLKSLFSKEKNVVFYSPSTAHFAHISPVLAKLSHPSFSPLNITVIAPEEVSIPHPNARHINDISKLHSWQVVDLFIATEFSIPFWLNTQAIYFGHGIGPKLTYQVSENLTLFDFVFTACKPIHDAQEKLLGREKLIKVGLPVLDQVKVRTQEIAQFHNIDCRKKTLLYAPSWSFKPEHLPKLGMIFDKLNSIKGVNIIVSPHPNLLDRKLCGGNSFFSDRCNFENLKFNLPPSPYDTLELAAFSDIVISDISSIFFEAAAMGKTTIFDGNRSIFKHYQADHVYKEIIKSNPVVQWDNFLVDEMMSFIEFDKFKDKRAVFIKDYLFNRGRATDTFIETIYRLLGIDFP